MDAADLTVLESGQLLGQVVRSSSVDTIGCHEVFYPAGLRLDRHAHERAFFGLTLNGHYSDVSSDKILEAHPRSVVFHAAGEQHSIAISPGDLRCFVLELDPAEIQQRYGVQLPDRTLHTEGGPIASLLTSIYHEFRHPDSCSSLAIQGYVLQLLVSTSRTDVEGGRDHPRWLDRVTEILHERFRSPLTLEEIAAEVGVPPGRISIVFRRKHRRSLADEQRRLRIEFACRRLLDAETPLVEIAHDAGFADQPHFSRAFRQMIGITPARYRRLLLG